MTFGGLVAYAGALAIAAALPGPGLAALIARSLGSGFRAAFFQLLGLILSDLIYLTAVVLGLAVLAQAFGSVFLMIKWAGILYLCWLAWSFWTSGVAPGIAEPGTRAEGLTASFLTGLTVALGNPKAMIFYLALTPTLVDVTDIALVDYLLLVLATLLVLLVVLVPYIALAARARWLLQSPRALKTLNRTAAMFMAAAAAAIALRQ